MTAPRNPHTIPVCPKCGRDAYCGMVHTEGNVADICWHCARHGLTLLAMARIQHDRQDVFAATGITR